MYVSLFTVLITDLTYGFGFVLLLIRSVFQIQTLNEQEWEKMQQAHVLANVQQAFSSSSSGAGSDPGLGGSSSSGAPNTGPYDLVGPSGLENGGSMGMPLAHSSSAVSSDRSAVFPAVDMLSPNAHTDAQTLALMLQEQLDAINNEIR